MLLSCQICQCIKRSPGENGQPVTLKFPIWAIQRVGNSFGCFVSSSYFSVLPLPLEVHQSTCESQFKKQGNAWEGNADPPHELEREGWSWSHCRRQSCSPVSAPCFASFCGENHPPASEVSQLWKSMKWGRNLSLAGPGTVPSTAQLLLLPLWVLHADSNSAKP